MPFRIALCLLLSICLHAPALALETPSYAIEDGKRMLLDGRDIFSYDSGEIYQQFHSDLIRFPGESDNSSSLPGIGYIGYADEEKPPNGIGLSFHFPSFVVSALSETPETQARRDALTALPLGQTEYPVVSVIINGPDVIGPFGVTAGMTLQELWTMFPEGSIQQNPRDTNKSVFRFRYLNSSINPSASYTFIAYLSKDGIVEFINITRNDILEWYPQ